MADPVVSIEVVSGQVPVPAAGGVLVLKVNAFDPDVGTGPRVIELQGQVRNPDSAEVFDAQITLTQEGTPGDTIDPTSYILDELSSAGCEVVQDANDPSLFTVTVPANA